MGTRKTPMVATRSTTRKALTDHSNVSSDGAHGKRVKISEDEIAMSGAPQGVLVQVDVLESSEYTPSEDPSGELALIQESLERSQASHLLVCLSIGLNTALIG